MTDEGDRRPGGEGGDVRGFDADAGRGSQGAHQVGDPPALQPVVSAPVAALPDQPETAGDDHAGRLQPAPAEPEQQQPAEGESRAQAGKIEHDGERQPDRQQHEQRQRRHEQPRHADGAPTQRGRASPHRRDSTHTCQPVRCPPVNSCETTETPKISSSTCRPTYQ